MRVKIYSILAAVLLMALTAFIWCHKETWISLSAVRAGYTAAEKAFSEEMPLRQELIDLNGAAAKMLNMRGYYSDDGIYVGENGYIMSAYPRTSTDYEFSQVLGLKEYLDRRGIKLLYVNKPAKYLDDSVFEKQFGVKSHVNENADLLMERLRNAGIAVLDLREKIREEGKTIYDMFYRTDHHWTTPSALWGAGHIARALNENCGFHIDTSIYEEDRYAFQTWKNCWLGEQGSKLGVTYTGLDDFTCIKPKFETAYTFKNAGDPFEGTFEDFIDETCYQPGNYKEDISWHYSYKQRDVINHNAEEGKILMLTDSYDQTTIPFLSLGVKELDNLPLREYMGDVSDALENKDYDTVIICYSCIMIGSHDYPGTSNYKIFSFL